MTLQNMVFTWPLPHRCGSDSRAPESHCFICSRGFAPKVSLLLLLHCLLLFFQLADKLFSKHLEEGDRVLQQSRG